MRAFYNVTDGGAATVRVEAPSKALSDAGCGAGAALRFSSREGVYRLAALLLRTADAMGGSRSGSLEGR